MFLLEGKLLWKSRVETRVAVRICHFDDANAYLMTRVYFVVTVELTEVKTLSEVRIWEPLTTDVSYSVCNLNMTVTLLNETKRT